MKNTADTNTETIVYMKKWFYDKQYVDDRGYLTHSCTVTKETEKAYQVIAKNNGFGQVCWIPKSCTLNTREELEAEISRQAEYEAQKQARWEAACKEYADLIAYAQKMGVRGVREGLRKETILNKMRQAGVQLPA